MDFEVIDFASWPRKPHFEHYDTSLNCSFSLTASVDVAHLKRVVDSRGLKLYPVFIYIVTKAVNMQRELRTGRDASGALGYYGRVSAQYLIFHDDTSTFTSCYTEYDESFSRFYESIVADMQRYRSCYDFAAVEAPANSFPVSCLPWISYSGFNLNLPLNLRYYAPIITWGKYEDVGGKLQMPITVQINHAVADGYHVAMFFKNVQQICVSFDEVMSR